MGYSAKLDPRIEVLFDGVEEADSIVVDPLWLLKT
jgi:hypothetical protein